MNIHQALKDVSQLKQALQAQAEHLSQMEGVDANHPHLQDVARHLTSARSHMAGTVDVLSSALDPSRADGAYLGALLSSHRALLELQALESDLQERGLLHPAESPLVNQAEVLWRLHWLDTTHALLQRFARSSWVFTRLDHAELNVPEQRGYDELIPLAGAIRELHQRLWVARKLQDVRSTLH